MSEKEALLVVETQAKRAEATKLELVRLNNENAALRAQVEELTRERDDAYQWGWDEAQEADKHAWSALSVRAEQAEAKLAAVVEALEEIEKGEGPFSRDPLTHASNVIESTRIIAHDALAAAREQPTHVFEPCRDIEE